MNDEPLHPWIEPELEARLVALVLGEASDFEKEELERLIEEQPELGLFRQRMEAVHGLLRESAEGEETPADAEWRLAPERREKVLAVLEGNGEEETAKSLPAADEPTEVSDEISPTEKPRIRRGLLAVAATVVVGALLAGLMFPASSGALRKSARPEEATAAEEPYAYTETAPQASTSRPRWDEKPAGRKSDADADVLLGETEPRDAASGSASLEAIRSTLHYGSDPLAQSDSKSTDLSLTARPDVTPGIADNRGAIGEIEGMVAFRSGGDLLVDAENGAISLATPEVPRPGGPASRPDGNAGSETDSESIFGVAPAPSAAEPVAPSDASVPAQKEWQESPGQRDEDSSANQLVSKLAAIPAEERSDLSREKAGKLSTDVSVSSAAAAETRPEPVKEKLALTSDLKTVVPEIVGGGSAKGRSLDRNDQDGDRFPSPEAKRKQSAEPAAEEERQVPAIAPNYVIRQQERVTKADEAATRGAQLRADGDHQGAIDQYRAALDLLPDAPTTEPRRRAYAKQFGRANSKLAKERAEEGRYPEAIALTEEVLQPSVDPDNPEARKLLEQFDDPESTELTPAQVERARRIQLALKTAEGYLELGDVDRADREFHKALSDDPYNTAARRGEETNERHKMNYHDTAYDQPRARMLKEVATGWEMPVPATAAPVNGVAPVDELAAGEPLSFGLQPTIQSATSSFSLTDTLKRARALRRTPPAGLDETDASEEAFSTFSLHVGDVSFQLAHTALSQGEWPDAQAIRLEEFVNAFDYGDPLPGPDEKVALQLEQAAHPFLQQRNLLRIALRTSASGRSSGTPLRLTLLLDNSGSMERVDREETVRRALAHLAAQFRPGDTATLISFARRPRLLADALPGERAAELVDLAAGLPSEGGTNLEEALRLAFEKAREQQAEGAQSRIVLLTDGAANLGDAEPESLAQLAVEMREAGIAFDAAGIGADGLNDDILEALTRKGDGRYYLLDRPENADAGFAHRIAGALRPAAGNVKVQVEFNPGRVATWKLLGFEKHRLEKEDFRDDSVDAAEMAAEESGVAVYQFEPKPDGTGDVGFVSVRFRDMASGEMVERRWPIPWRAAVPRVDQAAPSLRLATAASMLAAKLRGGALGEAIDLEELSRLAAGLPKEWNDRDRVRKLREMIEAARTIEGGGR